MQGYVTTHSEHGITTVEFFTPHSNSLPTEILEKLSHEIHFAGTHDETKVIILKRFFVREQTLMSLVQ